jgi:tRNA(Arg) A34 adenosine deaminase TadA
MRRALELGCQGVDAGLGGPFGAVILRDGRLLAEGQNRVTSSGDPTAHAEIVAIRAACARLGSHVLAGCEIFASCEPCPMCLAAIEWARLERLWFAADRHAAAAAGFDDERLYVELAKPIEERELPTERLLPTEAGAPFEAWASKADRRPY